MKNRIKAKTLMLCLASLMLLHACSKENAHGSGNATTGDFAYLMGEWECTWSKAISGSGVAENAYAGAVWKFEHPDYEKAGYKQGVFHVTIQDKHHDGRYYFHEAGDNYWIPRLGVCINGDDEFFWFHGLSGKEKYSVHMGRDYSILLSEMYMTIYIYDETDDNLQDSELYLKFRKVR